MEAKIIPKNQTHSKPSQPLETTKKPILPYRCLRFFFRNSPKNKQTNRSLRSPNCRRGLGRRTLYVFDLGNVSRRNVSGAVRKDFWFGFLCTVDFGKVFFGEEGSSFGCSMIVPNVFFSKGLFLLGGKQTPEVHEAEDIGRHQSWEEHFQHPQLVSSGLLKSKRLPKTTCLKVLVVFAFFSPRPAPRMLPSEAWQEKENQRARLESVVKQKTASTLWLECPAWWFLCTKKPTYKAPQPEKAGE